jgi:cytochrome c-type biogenesis protein CcmH
LNTRFLKVTSRKLLLAGLLAVVSCTQSGADRYVSLGHQLICICGCNQLLGACTHINCPSAKPMQAELRKFIDQGMSDKEILAAFVDKYDKRVLSAPPTTDWFNLSAWMMPFAVLAVGAFFIVRLLRSWRAATPEPSAAPATGIDTSRYEAEIEEELKKLTPED